MGRKLIAERHGNGILHGGGAFTGKDFTKGDKSLKIIGDQIAKNLAVKTKDDYVLSCKYGDETFTVVSSTGETTVEHFSNWIPRMQKLYTSYSPVKPSDYLTKEEIIRLEELLEKLSGSELKNSVW